MEKRLLRIMGTDFKELIYFSGTDKTESANPLSDNTIIESVRSLALLLNKEIR